MPLDKFAVQYDSDYDVLLIFNKAGRSSHGVELGSDIDISFDNRGKLVNLSLNHASAILTNLTGKKTTMEMLSQIKGSKIAINESGGVIYVTFSFTLKDSQKIEDVLPIKAMNYSSPVTVAR